MLSIILVISGFYDTQNEVEQICSTNIKKTCFFQRPKLSKNNQFAAGIYNILNFDSL